MLTFFCSNISIGQLPNVDPIFDSVFIENFSNGPAMDTSKWYSHYPWGSFAGTNSNNNTGYCKNTPNMDLAGLQMNPLDTHNVKIYSGTCKLIGLKENDTIYDWRFDTCNAPTCQSNCFYNPNNNTYFCMYQVGTPYKYTNGMLASLKKFKYGYFEIKFKVNGITWPSNYNSFTPTFWLFDGNTTVPWSEIDVYEINGTNGYFGNNIHVIADPNDTTHNASNEISFDTSLVNITQWHTASVNWTPKYIDFFLDGQFLNRSTKDTNQYLLPMPMYIENGVPPLNFCIPIDSVNTPFPVTYEIDYVKVYQPKLDCANDASFCNTTHATFNYKIYKSLTIGGSGCSATFNNGNSHLAGTDFVLLQEGFEAGSNITMTIDTPPCYTGMTITNRTQSQAIHPPIKNYKQIYTNARQGN